MKQIFLLAIFVALTGCATKGDIANLKDQASSVSVELEITKFKAQKAKEHAQAALAKATSADEQATKASALLEELNAKIDAELSAE